MICHLMLFELERPVCRQRRVRGLCSRSQQEDCYRVLCTCLKLSNCNLTNVSPLNGASCLSVLLFNAIGVSALLPLPCYLGFSYSRHIPNRVCLLRFEAFADTCCDYYRTVSETNKFIHTATILYRRLLNPC